MIPSQAEQRSFLRRSVGHQEDTALISDSLLDDCLDQALREINQSFALKGVGSFHTVAQQQKYEPLAVGSYGITKVFYPGQCITTPNGNTQSLIDRFMISEAVDEYGGGRGGGAPLVWGVFPKRGKIYPLFWGGGLLGEGVWGFLCFLSP